MLLNLIFNFKVRVIINGLQSVQFIIHSVLLNFYFCFLHTNNY